MDEEFPLISDRIKSTTIDSIIIIGFIYFTSDILNTFENIPNYVRVLLFSLILLYEPVCTVFGGTIGNNKMGIRVRSNSNHLKKINFFQAIIRFTFKFLLGWLSFISVFIDKKSRTIHDYLSGSVMVKV